MTFPLFDKLLWCLVGSSPIFVRCQCLIARKIAELFSSNRGMSQFYEACGINDVRSRGSVLCLFAASSGGAVFTATTLFVAKTNDPGGRQGNTVRIITRWRRPVASNAAHDDLHWAMCSVLQWWIAKGIETASEGGAYACHHRFVVVHNLS